MKLIDYLDEFLENAVNLQSHKLTILDNKIEIVNNFLKNNKLLKDNFQKIIPQGSYKHKTIIRPVTDSDEFDVDILVLFNEFKFWEPKDYIKNINNEFVSNGNYEDITKPGTRCVTINYSGDFHIDIVPMIIRNGKYYICNRQNNTLEETDPYGYSNWLTIKNDLTGNKLKKVIKILKYLRDHKNTFSVKSILLTTLLGNQVYNDDNKDLYCDLPTALKVIIQRMNDYLQSNTIMPIVKNPSCENEDFNRHWDQEIYLNFRAKIKNYSEKLIAAYEENDKNKSVYLWQEIFGEKFPSIINYQNEFTRTLKKQAENNRPWFIY